MAERMFPFVIRMPKELYDQLERMAERESRSTSGMARLLIERGIVLRRSIEATVKRARK